MTNDRHEKALEAAEKARTERFVSSGYAESLMDIAKIKTECMGQAIAAYLQAMDAVIVPREPTKEMVKNGSYEVSFLTHKGSEHCYLAMLSKAPNHFTNGE